MSLMMPKISVNAIRDSLTWTRRFSCSRRNQLFHYN